MMRRSSTAAGKSWRKWEPSTWELAYQRQKAHDRRVRIVLRAYLWLIGGTTLLWLMGAWR